MKCLLLAMLRGKKKKHIILMIGIAACMFFLMAVDTMYQGYCKAQLENAYSAQGNWDVCVRIDGADYTSFAKGMEGLTISGFHSSTYCLRLEPVPEDLLYDEWKDFVTDYYLATYGITEEKENVLPYHLMEGRWPQSEQEIVVPKTLKFGERSAKNGTIQIGDKLTLEYGRRKTEAGVYTQEQISGKENFEQIGTQEYTVCGFLEYPDYTTDKFVLYGYVGLGKADQYLGEELVIYYKLDELTTKNLETANEKLSMEEGSLEVQTNTMLAGALEMVEQSDYMHSVRFGLYLFEGLLVVIGLCIAAANQYQSIVEDKKQICLFDSVGASRVQLCMLYGLVNLAIILFGFVLSFGLYSIFVLLIRTSLLSNLRNNYFRTGIYTPDLHFTIFALVFLMVVLLFIVCKLLLAQIPARREAKKQMKKTKQPEIKDLLELAGSNNRAMRIKSWIQVLVFCVVLIAVPVFLAIFSCAYRIGEQITRSASSDFYFLTKGFFSETDDELRNNPDVKLFQRQAYGVRKTYIPAEYLPAEVEKVIRESSGRTISESFTENNELEDGVTLLFVNEENYNIVNELNHGTMPSYEEFIKGDNGIIRSVFYLPDTEQWVDVGKGIAERMEEIPLYPYTEDEIFFKINIIGSIFEDYADDFELGLRIYLYVPEHVYEDYCKNTGMYIGTTYGIDGYKGRLQQLGKTLQEMAWRYNLHFQDNVSESSAAKDSLVIQYITCLSCAVVVILMCACAINIMGKVDFIARQKTYDTYRILGLDRRKAFFIQMLEQILPFTSAVLISAILHYIAVFTFMKNVYLYYGITLGQIGGIFLIVIIAAAVLLMLNAFFITRRRYQTGLCKAQ